MDPTSLIKGKTYLLGATPGKEIPVKYYEHTLNYRVFIDSDGNAIKLDETSAKNIIKENDTKVE